MAKLSGLLDEDLGKDWHGKWNNAADGVSAVVSVSILATEAVSLKVCNSFIDSGRVGHVGCSSGKNVSALLASPVTWGEDGGLLAKTKSGADITIDDKVVVDAGSHVWEPHVYIGLTCSWVSCLWADKSLEEASLFVEAFRSKKVINQSSSTLLALLAGDCI